MNVHRALATLALSLMHCGYDPASTLPSLEPVAGEVAARPRDEAPRAWEGAVLPVLRHGNLRYVVVASGLGDDVGEGIPTFVDTGYPYALDLPAREADVPRAWRGERTLTLHDPSGARCAVRATVQSVLSRFSDNMRTEGYWDGGIDEARGVRVRDEALLREAWSNGAGGRLLAAVIPSTGCPEATYATVSDGPVTPFVDAPADAPTRAVALAAFRAAPRWAELQAMLHDSPNEEGAPLDARVRWDTWRGSTPDVRVWRAEGGARTFVTVRAEVPFEGCGVFAGALLQVFERVDGRLVPRTAADTTTTAPVTRALDADGDGAPEFFAGDDLLWLGPAGYEPVISTSFPQHGCPC
ncbi:MAG: hypothetical protein U0325_32700 [Polyangiales bacterium]